MVGGSLTEGCWSFLLTMARLVAESALGFLLHRTAGPLTGRSGFCSAFRGLAIARERARGDYAEITEGDISYFQSVLGTDHVITDERLVGFNKDWMNKFEGRSKLALRPKTTQEVSQIMKHCNERRLAVVPQGGNTGLVGGSVPVFDEIVVSMARMNEVKSIDPLSGILVCQAGCILQTLDEELSKVSGEEEKLRKKKFSIHSLMLMPMPMFSFFFFSIFHFGFCRMA